MTIRQTKKMTASASRIRSLASNVKARLAVAEINAAFTSYVDIYGGKVTHHDLTIGTLNVLVRPLGYVLTFTERAYVERTARSYVQRGALDISGLIDTVGMYARLDAPRHWANTEP